MKCPKCGKEMREGWVAARYPMIFTQTRDKRTIFALGNDVTLHGGMNLDPVPGRICESCRCVILDY